MGKSTKRRRGKEWGHHAAVAIVASNRTFLSLRLPSLITQLQTDVAGCIVSDKAHLEIETGLKGETEV
jgi:hypothetical protein